MIRSVGVVFACCSVVLACDAPFAMLHAAAARAPSDLDCPTDKVSQHHHASRLATEPAFRGCGRVVVYHCTKTSGVDDATCVPTWLGADRS
jgi:hypothetical protein